MTATRPASITEEIRGRVESLDWDHLTEQLDTVERARPVSRAMSARLTGPCSRTTSSTRNRLNSRSELSEPPSLSSGTRRTLSDLGNCVKPRSNCS